jgi:hypothetical protein
MQRPDLGTRLGHLEDLDDDPWLKASQAIADCMEHGDLESPSAAALIEFFRGTPHGPLMEEARRARLRTRRTQVPCRTCSTIPSHIFAGQEYPMRSNA